MVASAVAELVRVSQASLQRSILNVEWWKFAREVRVTFLRALCIPDAAQFCRAHPEGNLMNTSLRRLLAPAALALVLGTAGFAAESGFVDFGKMVAPEKGEFVDITLGKGVLKFASFITKCKNADAAQLISGLSRVKVNVVGLDDSNRRQTTERMNALRETLVREGWDPIVTVRGKKQEDVAVYLKQRDGEVIDGVVVLVIDNRKQEAVFVNVVGQIKAEQLALIGEHLDIQPLKRGPVVQKG
jgi:hypothetical protein